MLCTLTVILVYTIPTVLLPVLFAEISADLNLSVIQLGIVWGSMSLSSMFIGLVGGALGDRIGSRHMLAIVCLLAGIFGILRSFASSYTMLVATMLLYGLIAPSIPPNLHKVGAYRFPKQRDISTVTISMGFALALFVGSRYTATWLSPLVGGWRNVLLLFGVLAILFSIIWFMLPKDILPPPSDSDQPFFRAVFNALRHVLQLREVWIIGVGSLLFWGCVRGFLGYTPLYLRGLGLGAESADSTLSLFFLGSLIFAVPSTILAQRLGSRRPILIIAMLLTGSGIALIGTGSQTLIVIGVFGAGMLFDGFMALHQAEILDLKGIGIYTGSALGTLVMFREIGGFLSPPIGNWLTQFGANVPFFFWGGLGLLAAAVFWFLPTKS